QQFRLGVLAVACVLIAGITGLRFCGSVSLPSKPPPPTPTGTQTQLLSKSTASPTIYKGFLDSDAAAAGVRAPTIEEMSRKLPYRSVEAAPVLGLGQPPIEVAGLRLRIEHSGNEVLMVIESKLAAAAAYQVTSVVSGENCGAAMPLPFNAVVIAKGASERRTE